MNLTRKVLEQENGKSVEMQKGTALDNMEYEIDAVRRKGEMGMKID